MALGGAVVVVLATLAGLTAVPALVAVAHRRITGPRAPGTGCSTDCRGRARPCCSRGWPRSRRPGRGRSRSPSRPACSCSRCRSCSAPTWPTPTPGRCPRTAEARQLHEVVQRDFNVGRAEPVVVVVDADPATAAVRDLLNQLNTMPGVVLMQPRPDIAGPGRDHRRHARGRDRRPDLPRPGARRSARWTHRCPLLVGGPAAELVDYQESVAGRLPIAVLVLFLATAILLFVLTGSLVIPVKALLMNALTLLATLGVLVVVFQWGVGDAVARLRLLGRDRRDHAGAALRLHLRAVDGLRGLPAGPDQGGMGPAGTPPPAR